VRYGVVLGRRVHLLSVDQQRVGAIEPLQAYAELLGMQLTVAENDAGFADALRRLAEAKPDERAQLVLVDTPGYGPAEWAQARRLAALCSEHGGLDVHLVLSLTTKSSDLRRTAERYGIFRPGRLLFTKADETDSHGAILNEAVRAGLPLSFVTAGQRVPEDIAPASQPYLAKLLLKNDLIG
jgi:flagellar biosynthesis protein FlhF